MRAMVFLTSGEDRDVYTCMYCDLDWLFLSDCLMVCALAVCSLLQSVQHFTVASFC